MKEIGAPSSHTSRPWRYVLGDDRVEMHELPALARVLAVCAHPDDESFGLGAIITAFTEAGAAVGVLCFTHGEASTLHGADGSLAEIRARELAAAGEVLRVSRVELLDHPDGELAATPVDELADEVSELARDVDADALLVFDHGGITGHPDHQRATDAALCAAGDLRVPVLAWAVPELVAETLNREFGTMFVGRGHDELDFEIGVDRRRQREAIDQHRSQSGSNPVLWRRLDLLGNTEHLRYLITGLEEGRDRGAWGVNP